MIKQYYGATQMQIRLFVSVNYGNKMYVASTQSTPYIYAFLHASPRASP